MLVSVRLGSHLPYPSRGRTWGAYLAKDPAEESVLAVHDPTAPTVLAYRANAAAWRVASVTDGAGKKRWPISLTDAFTTAVTLTAAGVAALAAVVVTRTLGHNGIGLFLIAPAAWLTGVWLTERLMVRRVDSVTADAKTRFITAIAFGQRWSVWRLAEVLDELEGWRAAGRLTPEEWYECRLYVWRLADLPMFLFDYRRGEVLSWLRAVAARAYRQDEQVTAGAPSRWW